MQDLLTSPAVGDNSGLEQRVATSDQLVATAFGWCGRLELALAFGPVLRDVHVLWSRVGGRPCCDGPGVSAHWSDPVGDRRCVELSVYMLCTLECTLQWKDLNCGSLRGHWSQCLFGICLLTNFVSRV